MNSKIKKILHFLWGPLRGEEGRSKILTTKIHYAGPKRFVDVPLILPVYFNTTLEEYNVIYLTWPQKMILTVSSSFFCKWILKKDINHHYFNFLFWIFLPQNVLNFLLFYHFSLPILIKFVLMKKCKSFNIFYLVKKIMNGVIQLRKTSLLKRPYFSSKFNYESLTLLTSTITIIALNFEKLQ